MDILKSKWVSLACSILNAFFAIGAFQSGSYLFGVICVAFCLFCLSNFVSQNKS